MLNLSMNSYVNANEINAFVNLAYDLKPDFVIFHTGFNDLHYARMIPLAFKLKGLNFQGELQDWMPRLYNLKSEPVNKPIVNPEGIGEIIPALVNKIFNFKNIVEASGEDLFWELRLIKLKKITKFFIVFLSNLVPIFLIIIGQLILFQ